MHSSKWNINFYSEIENWNKSLESVRNWQFFHFAISDVSWSAWNMKRNSITCPLSANNNKEKVNRDFWMNHLYKKDFMMYLKYIIYVIFILSSLHNGMGLSREVRCWFEVVQCSNIPLLQIHSWTNNDKSDLGPTTKLLN